MLGDMFRLRSPSFGLEYDAFCDCRLYIVQMKESVYNTGAKYAAGIRNSTHGRYIRRG